MYLFSQTPETAKPVTETVREVATATGNTVTKTFDNSWQAVVDSFTNAWHQTISIAPQIVAMVVV
ncbi:MAG: hypothetical protein JNN09_09605, partial [Alphaproteobacteria bacterium]|nr:hypothetical protein [Alphaproteobacteria bacterium]